MEKIILGAGCFWGVQFYFDQIPGVRVCPVNAIEVKPQKAHPNILTERCVGCGLCYVSCTPHAIEFRDSRAIPLIEPLIHVGDERFRDINAWVTTEQKKVRRQLKVSDSLNCRLNYSIQGKRCKVPLKRCRLRRRN